MLTNHCLAAYAAAAALQGQQLAGLQSIAVVAVALAAADAQLHGGVAVAQGRAGAELPAQVGELALQVAAAQLQRGRIEARPRFQEPIKRRATVQGRLQGLQLGGGGWHGSRWTPWQGCPAAQAEGQGRQ